MKYKLHSTVAASVLFLGASDQAQAVYLGLSRSLYTTVSAGGQMRDVYRVYADFSHPGDLLSACAGLPESPLTIDLHGATAFNVPVGGSLPADAVVMASYPDVQWDSYVTIGLEAGYAPTPEVQLSITPGFPQFITSAGITNNTNMGWVHPPVANTPGLAGSSLQVLIMQITVNAGDAAPTGTLAIQYRPVGALQGTIILNQSFVPGPGALGVLAMTLACGTRRRRRME